MLRVGGPLLRLTIVEDLVENVSCFEWESSGSYALNNRSILVTGGTGSFGKKFVEIILNEYPGVTRMVVYSRDELKQYEMAQRFSAGDYPQLRYFIGDVRDKDRLWRAMEGIYTVSRPLQEPGQDSHSTWSSWQGHSTAALGRMPATPVSCGGRNEDQRHAAVGYAVRGGWADPEQMLV